jgi:hypothetical protein
VRWTPLAIFGTVLATVGIAGLGLEIADGSDIWRRGNVGIAPLVIGGFCVWHGLAERERRARSKPLWPTLIWLTILFAIGVLLYVLAAPLAFLYALVSGLSSGSLCWRAGSIENDTAPPILIERRADGG